MLAVSLLWIEIFLFGAIVGSFLNVCIYRIPRHLGLGGRSFCPSCRHRIFWYDNIPLVSFLLLKGQCRFCHCPISFSYPLVELFSSLSALAVFYKTGSLTGFLLWFSLFLAPLLMTAFIDAEHQVIPDIITLPGIPVGFLVTLWEKWPDWGEALIFSSIGALIGGGTLIVIGTLYYLIRKREGLGGGDVKLCTLLGAFLGWQGIIFIFLIGSILGTLFVLGGGLFHPPRDRSTPLIIPFGPFLVAASFIFYFWGDQILNWYALTFGLSL